MTNPHEYSFSKGFEDALSNTDENDINDLWITTNNNNVEDAASKPASATIVTVVRKGGQTASANGGGNGGSADSMRTVFSNSTNALGFVTPNVQK